MSGGYGGLTLGYIESGGTVVTTERTVKDTQTALTGIDTKSDAWGKVIPVSFGRVRVPGALVWASQFYKTTQTFDETTTTKNIYTEHSYSIGTDAESRGAGFGQTVINDPQDVSSIRSQVTHNTVTDNYIDLCYSFGKEGDPRATRYVDKIRINDIVAYDQAIGYIAPGLGFSVRYGYDNAVPSLLAKYPNGKFHYPGQTLIMFDKFPTASFGDSVPSSIDVEFGCCLADQPTGPCYFTMSYLQLADNAPCVIQNAAAVTFPFRAGDLLVMAVGQKTGTGDHVLRTGWTSIPGASLVGTFGTVEMLYKIVNQSEVDDLNSKDFYLTDNASAKCVLQIFRSTLANILPGNIKSATVRPFAKNQAYEPVAETGKGYAVLVKFGLDAMAFEYKSDFYANGEPIGSDITPAADDSGYAVARMTIQNPCMGGN